MLVEKSRMTASFANSEGWNVPSGPRLIQRRALLRTTPTPGASTAASSKKAMASTGLAAPRSRW